MLFTKVFRYNFTEESHQPVVGSYLDFNRKTTFVNCDKTAQQEEALNIFKIFLPKSKWHSELCLYCILTWAEK